MNFITAISIFAIIIFIGYFIKSLTGFAGALFSVPLLAIFFSIRFVVPVVSLIDTLSGLILFFSIKKHIDKKELAYVLSGLIFGTLIGVYLLKSLASNRIKFILGVLVILFSIKMIFENYFSFKKLKSYFGSVFGMLGGIAGGMFTTNGPPITLYLSHQIRNKQILRGTLISIFFIDSIWRNSLYLITKTFTLDMYKLVLFLVPVLFIATLLGSKIHLKLNEKAYRLIIGIILLISGIILIL